MLKAIRILFSIALLALATTTVFKHLQINAAHPVDMNDPALDSRYASVASLNGWDALHYPDQALLREYDGMKQKYVLQASVAQDAHNQAENDRNIVLALSLFALIALGIACLPWDRWISHGVSKMTETVMPVAQFMRDRIAREGADIIGQDKLKRYSVADELLKWSELLEKGVITEDEFDEARRKILKRSA